MAAKVAAEPEDLADEVERTEQFPARAYQLLAENDLLRLTLPGEWGGQSMSLIDYFPVLQEIAKIHGTFRMFGHGQNGMWALIGPWGPDREEKEGLPRPQHGGSI